MFKITLLFAALCTIALPAAAAAPEVGIAAVVNDEVITTKDIEDRLDFIGKTTDVPDDEEARARIRPQVLRQLVDETLQMQEARRLGLAPDERDITQAIAMIEKQRSMVPGGVLEDLKDHNVSESYFKHQLAAQVAWSKIIGKRLRPAIKVTEDEIERARAQAALNPSQNVEYSLLLLPLAVEKPEQEPDVKALAQHLADSLSKGASFDAITRQVTPNAPPPTPFWVEAATLDPALAAALKGATPNTTLPPVRTAEGYAIVQLLDKRAKDTASSITELTAKLFTLSPAGEATPGTNDFTAAAEAVRATPGTCEDTSSDAKLPATVTLAAAILEQPLEDFSEAFRPLLQTLTVGNVSAPVATPYGLQMVLLCERVDVPPALADKDKTYQRLMTEKMDLEVKKYLRNLRRDAFIEMK